MTLPEWQVVGMPEALVVTDTYSSTKHQTNFTSVTRAITQSSAYPCLFSHSAVAALKFFTMFK